MVQLTGALNTFENQGDVGIAKMTECHFECGIIQGAVSAICQEFERRHTDSLDTL